MFKDYFEKRRLRQQFGKYVSDDALEKILSEEPADFGKMEPAQIEFVCMLLRDNASPDELSKQIILISNLCIEFSTVLSYIFGPLLLAEFSSVRPVTDAPQKRVALAGKIRLELGNSVKLIHGAALGHEGLLGGNTRCAYGLVFPGFGKALATLTQLDFGEMAEFKP